MRRTQIYLSDDQLARLKRAAKRRHTSMADLVRAAVDSFLRRDGSTDPEDALDRTLGSLPELEVPPRAEWDRRLA